MFILLLSFSIFFISLIDYIIFSILECGLIVSSNVGALDFSSIYENSLILLSASFSMYLLKVLNLTGVIFSLENLRFFILSSSVELDI